MQTDSVNVKRWKSKNYDWSRLLGYSPYFKTITSALSSCVNCITIFLQTFRGIKKELVRTFCKLFFISWTFRTYTHLPWHWETVLSTSQYTRYDWTSCYLLYTNINSSCHFHPTGFIWFRRATIIGEVWWTW